MLKQFMAGLMFLFLFVPAFGQEYWSTVPAPTQAPAVYQTGFSHNSDYTWFYPYKRPTPGGVIRVSNTIIDSNGKLGAWSEPKELTVKSGWRLWGGSWNLPCIEDCSGVAWKLEIVSVNPADDFQSNPYMPGKSFYLYTNWGGSYLPNETSPASGFSPFLQQLTEDAWRYYSLEKFSTGGTFQTIAPAPTVVAASLPIKVFQLAYCRVTETGETALSPAYTFDLGALPDGTSPAEVGWLRCVIHEYHPQGTLGLHFYRREQIVAGDRTTTWSDWKRLPDAECYGEPTEPDDWLWPIWKRQCLFLRYVDNAPVHSPVANPQSRLSDIHRLFRGDPAKDKDVLQKYGLPTDKVYCGDIILKPYDYFNVYCPVIDEWGNGDTGTTNAPPDQKFKRKIKCPSNEMWFISQQQSQSGHKSWPVVVIHNQYSQWHNTTITASGGDALTYSDYSGGQAFGNRFYGCLFNAPMTGKRVTCGIRIDAACAPSHHPSEQLFSDCYVSGGIGAILSGTQAANIRFQRLHIGSNATDPRGSVFYVQNPNPLKFNDGCFCDSYINGQNGSSVIFRVDTCHTNIQIQDIWVDAGFRRFLESNNVSTQLTMTDGKLNVRGDKPALGLLVGNPVIKSTWLMTGIQIQRDPGTSPPRIISHSYRLAEPLLERTGMQDLVLKTPSAERATAMFKRFSNANLAPMEEPGYRAIIDFDLVLDVPTLVNRPRTQAEIDEAYLPLSKIKNLPTWGKVFFKEYYLKNVAEEKIVKVTQRVQSTRHFNSLTTGLQVATEDLAP